MGVRWWTATDDHCTPTFVDVTEDVQADVREPAGGSRIAVCIVVVVVVGWCRGCVFGNSCGYIGGRSRDGGGTM